MEAQLLIQQVGLRIYLDRIHVRVESKKRKYDMKMERVRNISRSVGP